MTAYPKRESHFAHSFCRTMFKACIAQRVGTDGIALLSLIAHTEDAAHYRRSVDFYNTQLAPMLGLSEAAFRRTRERCVKAGWLFYRNGGKYRPGTYHVTVPESAQNIDDSASDEGAEGDKPQGVNGGADGEPTANRRITDAQASSNRHQSDGQPTDNQPASNPVPVPVKKQSRGFDPQAEPLPAGLNGSPDFLSAWQDWIAHRKEIRHPLTPTSCREQLTAFQRAGPAESVRAIRKAIKGGWRGVFPEEKNANGRSNSPGQVHPDDAGRAFRDADPGDAGAGEAIPAGR